MYVCTYVCISFNTGKSVLPDIYSCYLRAHSAQGQVFIYIRNHHKCLCTYHLWHSKICPNSKLTSQLLYKVMDTGCDCGFDFLH